MKDIYELLNDVNVDDDGFEEMEITELEKTKVKSMLKQSISKKKKRMSWKMNVAAAAVLIGLSTTTAGLAFPAYAGNIPVIGIFSDSWILGKQDCMIITRNILLK